MNKNKYLLVEFVEKTLYHEQKGIECVPTNWIFSYNKTGFRKYFSKFIPPPYNPECRKKLENMIREQVEPPEDWKYYAVTVRESVASYEDAMQRLQHLTMDTEESVCTTGCDKPQKEAALTTKSFAESAIEQEKEICSYEESLDEETTNYTFKFEEKIADILRLSSQNQNPEIGSQQKAFELSDENCESESEYSYCSSQSIRESTNSEVRPTKEKGHVSTSTEEENGYLILSVTDVNDIKLQNLHVEICTLKYEQSEMIKTIKEMLAVRADERAPHIDQRALFIGEKALRIDKNYKLTLPFDTYKKFYEFDNIIREHTQLEEYFKQILLKEFDDKKSLVENITTILKKFITKDVAVMFNVQRSSHGKYVFQDTYFYNCLEIMIINKIHNKLIPRISIHDLLINLDIAFANAKTWNI